MKATIAFLLAIVSLAASAAGLDDTLFTRDNLVTGAKLTLQEQTQWERWQKSPSVKSLFLVVLNPITMKTGDITVTTPDGKAKTYRGKMSYVEHTKYYHWQSDDAGDHAHFTMKDGVFYGNFSRGSEFYTLMSLSERYYVLIEGNQTPDPAKVEAFKLANPTTDVPSK